MKTFSFLTLAACLSLALSAPAYASKSDIETFTVIQAQPTIKHIDVGAAGGSHGDMLAFEAPFTTENGAKGVMSGIIITVALPDGVGGEHFDRVGNIVLDFGGVDSLVLAGKSLYGTGEGEMTKYTPQVRAVTGGTGRYIGARGQITTTRVTSGEYKHVVELLK
jgi:hypothetical protein